ncbi:MAG: DUF2115 family protein [Archaeoglobales archaeon]|nr:DUF2115 family protein [Archaeoglobi archaeon]NHW23149.1 DUF2115 family protein [Archaeoglobales archaeon]
MQKRELLEALRKEALKITHLDFALAERYLAEEFKFVPENLSRAWIEEITGYFAENLFELMRKSDEEGEIEEEKLKGLMERLKKEPENEYEKAFLKISRVVVPYLIFIARKPVHSPRIKFPGGQGIRQLGDKYFCPAKEKQLNPYSFCEFCVCEKLEE